MKVKIDLSVQNEVNRLLNDLAMCQGQLSEMTCSTIQSHFYNELFYQLAEHILSRKNKAKLKFKANAEITLNTAQCYMLYDLFTCIPDEYFTDISIVRRVLAAIDQAIPVKRESMFLGQRERGN